MTFRELQRAYDNLRTEKETALFEKVKIEALKTSLEK